MAGSSWWDVSTSGCPRAIDAPVHRRAWPKEVSRHYASIRQTGQWVRGLAAFGGTKKCR